jgi:hypothetical protein
MTGRTKGEQIVRGVAATLGNVNDVMKIEDKEVSTSRDCTPVPGFYQTLSFDRFWHCIAKHCVDPPGMLALQRFAIPRVHVHHPRLASEVA